MDDERNEVSEVECLTLTVEEAAHLLGISRGLAYEQVRLGKLPCLRFGRRVVIPRRAVERLLEHGNDGVTHHNSKT